MSGPLVILIYMETYIYRDIHDRPLKQMKNMNRSPIIAHQLTEGLGIMLHFVVSDLALNRTLAKYREREMGWN